MSDLHPVTLFFILHESLGAWLWLSLAIALLLLAGVVMSARKLYCAGRSMKRPILVALIVGLAVAAAMTFAVPSWTLADIGALSAVVDYVFAFLLALIPGAIAAALAFMLAARRCKGRLALAT